MTSIQPELWVKGARAAVAFYQAAFDAVVLHRDGHGARSRRECRCRRDHPDRCGARLASGSVGPARWLSILGPGVRDFCFLVPDHRPGHRMLWLEDQHGLPVSSGMRNPHLRSTFGSSPKLP